MKHREAEVLVRVEGLSKKFCRNLKRSLVYGGTDIVKGFLGMEKSSMLRNDEFWAIENVNFELRRGECLGLIGHNGAGKSTLLKMLNGLIRPDKGRIEMNGKVGALIELGAGFSPFLTGRENVYNNGAVLGFSKAEIDRRFDEIVEFAELKDFIDTPVQNYSSGMKVRLGFAIAAHMEPDILLIDEVLAVGDMGFVLKCINRMDVLKQKTAMIFVSHAMPQISRMCSSVLLLSNGKQIAYTSDISYGLSAFYGQFDQKYTNYIGSPDARLVDVKLFSKGRDLSSDHDCVVEYGAEIEVVVTMELFRLIAPHLYLAFYDKEQRGFAEVYNFNDKVDVTNASGIVSFTAKFTELLFSTGRYSITIGLYDKSNGSQGLFVAQSALYFNVVGGYQGWVPVQLRPEWSQQSKP
jgi:lipopolysaccharide transport system ATP-binding protein